MSPARAQTANGTRDFTGILPTVVFMAFPSKALPIWWITEVQIFFLCETALKDGR